MTKPLTVLAVLLLALALVATPVSAASTDAPAPGAPLQEAEDAQDQDRGPEANLDFLFAAYAVVWVAFFAYLFFLSRRQRDLEQEVRALRRALEAQDERAGLRGAQGEEP